MHRTCYFTVLSASLLLPACVIDHGLGQTDTEVGSDDDGTDTDAQDSGVDPSATSGQLPTATSEDGGPGDASASVGSATATSDDGGSSEDGGGSDCDPYPEWLQWTNTPGSFDPVVGIDASFSAALGGHCWLLDIQTEDSRTDLTFDCVLSGRIDGDPEVVDQQFSPTFSVTSASPIAQWFPVADATTSGLDVRVVLDHWGMAWSRWAVFEQGDDILMDLVDGEYIDPTESTVNPAAIENILQGEPWHGSLTLGTDEAYCPVVIGEDCGEQPQALTIAWEQDSPQLYVHAARGGIVFTPVEELMYQVYANSVSAIPRPTCTDTPLGDYRFALHALTP